MSILKREPSPQTAPRKARAAHKNITKMFTWSVLAGLALGSSALGADAPDAPAPAAAPDKAAAVAGPNKAAPATAVLLTTGLNPAGGITLMVNKSVVLTTRAPYKRVSIAQPDVADVNLVGPAEVLLTAKKPGTTQLILWDDQDRSQVVDVNVTFDLRALQEQLKTVFPGVDISASSANGTIVLKGHVPDVSTALQAAALAAPYGTTKDVLNLLEISGGQQIMLQVRFAEVARSATTNFGFNAFATDGRAKFGINNGPGASPTGSLATSSTNAVDSSVALFGSGGIGRAQFELFLDALRQNNLLRVLAEPNLIAINGKSANFVAGGEFPIPVPQAGGSGGTAITVEYKQYGIQLHFTPTVLGNGRLRLHVSPEVSDLDYTNSVTLQGFVIPALTKRSLETEVELADGQTFALGGLLNDRVTANKTVTPLLGDLPVLGALFRSVRYVRNETELVILVTPRIVQPMNPEQVPLLPGELWRQPTESQLLWERDLGGPAADTAHAPAPKAAGAPDRFHGHYGFNPAPAAADQK
ncbi:MAG: type and secretion system protein [Phycisphaerales bacterium]|nr:type and secretion system protein [Phycisphaerales bacterium]